MSAIDQFKLILFFGVANTIETYSENKSVYEGLTWRMANISTLITFLRNVLFLTEMLNKIQYKTEC